MTVSSHVKTVLLCLLKWTGVFRLCRWIYRSHVLILCYHGGARDKQHDYNGMLFMRRQTFAGRLNLLQRLGIGVISLDALINPSASQTIVPGSSRAPRVVLTFDDGWETTFSDLIPELYARGLPASVYLHTRPIIEQTPLLNLFFKYQVWCELNHQRVLDRLPPFPGMDAWQYDSQKQALEREAERRAHSAQSPSDTPISREVGTGFDYACPATLQEASRMRGIRLEAHGHDHHYIPDAPEALQENIGSCQEAFADLGLPAPVHFCYPSGEYDCHAARILLDRGVVSATTCDVGWVKHIHSHNRYYLPRFLDSERYSDLEFEAEISGFMDLMRQARKRLGVQDGP